MADETEGCWLAETTSDGREGEMLKNCEMLMDMSEVKGVMTDQQKGIRSKILPCHEQLFQEHSELQEKIKYVLKMLSEKDEKLETLKHQIEQEMEQYNEEKFEMEEKLKLQEERLAQINDRMCTEQAEFEKLKEICEKDRQDAAIVENEVIEFERNRTDGNKNLATPSESIDLLLQQVDHLSDMVVNCVKQNVVSVSIFGRQETDGERREIEVKSDVCCWNDLIDTALNTGGDVVWLLGEIKRRFHSVHSLQEEVELLQKRYAIDWQPEQNLIDVIIPGNRQTKCRLQLDSNYQTNQSVVCLHADEALKEKISSIEQKAKNKEIFGLTQWLEQLHQTSPS